MGAADQRPVLAALLGRRARPRRGFRRVRPRGPARRLPPPVPEGAAADHWLRVFLLLFGRDALRPREAREGRSFLDAALAEGRRYEQRITAALSRAVFDQVFPELVAAVGARGAASRRPPTPAWLAQARDASLRLLYRLLFLLYAEDRDLLPVRAEATPPTACAGCARRRHASPMSGTRSRRARAPGGRGSRRCSTRWRGAIRAWACRPTMAACSTTRRRCCCRPEPCPMRCSRRCSMRCRGCRTRRRARWINYRDLSVQHLGGIYERLLERDPVPDGQGGVTLRPNPYARKHHRLLLHARRAGAADPAPRDRPAAGGAAGGVRGTRRALAPRPAAEGGAARRAGARSTRPRRW